MSEKMEQAGRPNQRLLVMGDIHGQLEKMKRVLSLAGYKPKQDRLVLLGDYVDRGPDSNRTVSMVMHLVESGAVALYGNHEDMMRQALKDRKNMHLSQEEIEQWYANGGEVTLASYRNQSDLLDEHVAFFQSLPRWHEEWGFLFVHAGIRPGISLEQQSPQELIWLREPYIQGYRGPQDVVTGHTPIQYLARYELIPDVTDISKPLIREHKIFLDTGAAWGGPLTVMELPSQQFWQA